MVDSRAFRSVRFARVVCAITVSTLLSAAAAQPPTVDASTKAIPSSLLAALDADDLHEREQATRRLIEDRSVTVESLWSAFSSQSALSFEQIERLRYIIEERYADVPAVMGISMSPVDEGLEVGQIVGRSPAAEALQVNDLILAIDDQALAISGMTTLHHVLARKMPGDAIILDVRRDGELLEIEMELADGRELPGFTRRDLETIMSRRRVLWREWLREQAPEPIVLQPSTWTGDIEGRGADDEIVRRAIESQRRVIVEELARLDEEIDEARRLLQSAGDAGLAAKYADRLHDLTARYADVAERLRMLNEREKRMRTQPSESDGAGG